MLSAARYAKTLTSSSPPALALNKTLAVFLGLLGIALGGPRNLRVIQVTWAMHLPEKEDWQPAVPLTTP